jgi:diamine N-acetyltransferase
MRETTFRTVTCAEIELLLQFVREYYEFDHLSFDEGIARTALENFLDDPTFGCIWWISADTETIGYFVLTLGYSIEYGGRNAFIDEVSIRLGQCPLV